MKKLLKRATLGVGAIALLAGAALGAVSLKANSILAQNFETHRIKLDFPDSADQAAIERGRHLVDSRYGCAACHGANLAGGVMLDEAPIGRLFGPNLTRGKGSVVEGYDMAEWDRSVRHGVKPSGRASLMPAEDFFRMSDAELLDIVAYARALPPTDNRVDTPSLGPVGKVLLVLGKFPLAARLQEPTRAHAAVPPETSDSSEFGQHLIATCTGCHRQNLAGGPMPFGPPDWPAAANLTSHESGLGTWSYEDFDRALTEGISKDGHALKKPMTDVVAGTRQMLPTERKAIWTYLRSLTSAPDGT